MHIALEHTFEKYNNSQLATTGEGPISDVDKKTLKYNLRKQDLFEQALFFSKDLFGIDQVTKLNAPLILEFTSSILMIVLSHHFQKRDIQSIIKGTQVDFQLVRDTMYKYSKKAEEKFFNDPCMAFLFIQFAVSSKARNQIMNKGAKNGLSEGENPIDMEMNTNESAQKAADISERILFEINQMKSEAAKMLKKTFIKRTEDICMQNIDLLSKL
jgi:hypothetical protein